MTELHAVAATFEAAADSINHRIGYYLFDERTVHGIGKRPTAGSAGSLWH